MVEPIWAKELLVQVAKDENRSKLPKVQWRQGRGEGTTGTYYRGSKRMTVRVGRDGQERQVFLHEIAHWLTKGKGHHKRFWLKLNDLLIRYDCYTVEYRERELRYKKKAADYLSRIVG